MTDDAQLNYLGDLFLANPQIRKRGVTFVQFVADPDRYLDTTARLLPEQHRVQQRLDRQFNGGQR